MKMKRSPRAHTPITIHPERVKRILIVFVHNFIWMWCGEMGPIFALPSPPNCALEYGRQMKARRSSRGQIPARMITTQRDQIKQNLIVHILPGMCTPIRTTYQRLARFLNPLPRLTVRSSNMGWRVKLTRSSGDQIPCPTFGTRRDPINQILSVRVSRVKTDNSRLKVGEIVAYLHTIFGCNHD